jgi:hypothetical protein
MVKVTGEDGAEVGAAATVEVKRENRMASIRSMDNAR